MMNRTAIATLCSARLYALVTAFSLAAGLLGTANDASAQCRRGGLFCAQVHVGISGGVYIGQPPPPPVVVYQPAPPPVVVYEPAPPPVVYYQPAPQVVVAPRPMVLQTTDNRPNRGWGLHGHVGGMISERVQMGGVTGAFRLRPNEHFGIDFGIGTYAGIDYNDNDRVEVPLTIDGMFFLNPRGQLQPYALIGVGVSFARVSGYHTSPGAFVSDDRGYAYYGGEIGGGLELRLNRHWAINADVRGFIRQRATSDDSQPEFVETDDLGRETGRTTNTSWGALGTIGATLYF